VEGIVVGEEEVLGAGATCRGCRARKLERPAEERRAFVCQGERRGREGIRQPAALGKTSPSRRRSEQGRMVRYSNGIEMNGHGRKSKSPDIAMAPIRNGNGVHQSNGHSSSTTHWKISRVFAENDEALINRKLPKELLLRAFSFLDVVSLCRCAQVSKSWNVLALDGSNWQKVDLFEFQVDVEGTVVENLARRCGGFLKSLSLNGCQAVGDSALSTFAQHCNNIERLNLRNCKKLSDRTCQFLARHCSKLQVLDVSSCSSLSDNSLRALAHGCPQLVSVNISWCELLTAQGVGALAEGCNKLRTFISKGCLHIGDLALFHLGRFCTNLEQVNFQGCRNIMDEGMIELAERCPGLRSVCVSNCSHLTDQSLVALATHCPGLVTLECAGLSHFTDAGFQALVRSCHRLERLDLEECVLLTDTSISQLAAHCPCLESLSLSHCELVTDEGIRHLGMSPCASENLTVLELDNCPLITDLSLDHLVGCHNLQRIELYDCQLITRAGIRRLRNHLPNIKVHAYFAPVTPPPSVGGARQRYCRCCAIL